MKKFPMVSAIVVPSFADILFVVVLLGLFFNSQTKLLVDGDTGYHIRTGEYILQSQSIPTVDLFSQHTPPLQWTAHEWLSELIMGAVHNEFGLTGIVAFFALLLALTFALLFWVLQSYGNDLLISSFVVLLAVAASSGHWLARPHLFSLLLMVVFHYLLESWHRERLNRLYLLPLIMVPWVNLHGGFMGGFILLGAYLAGTALDALGSPDLERQAKFVKLRELALALGGCLAACLLNPLGYRILLFPLRLVSDGYLQSHIQEFMPPDLGQVFPFVLMVLLLILVLALSDRRLETTEVILVVGFTYMALHSARYIPLFALATAPVLARKTGEAFTRLGGSTAGFLARRSASFAENDSLSTGRLWPAAAICVVLALTWSGKVQHSFDPEIKAVAACDFMMKEKITGNMFCSDKIGNYVIYRAYPSYKAFFDGRSDMYGAEFIKDYSRVITFQPGWDKILDKQQVTWIVFETDSPLCRFLLNQRQWRLIYCDRLTSIFVKAIPQNRELIEKYPNIVPPGHT